MKNSKDTQEEKKVDEKLIMAKKPCSKRRKEMC